LPRKTARNLMNIDKIINIVRNLNENMSVSVGSGYVGSGPETSSPQASAGYDKIMKFKKRKKPTIIAKGLMPGARKRWSGEK